MMQAFLTWDLQYIPQGKNTFLDNEMKRLACVLDKFAQFSSQEGNEVLQIMESFVDNLAKKLAKKDGIPTDCGAEVNNLLVCFHEYLKKENPSPHQISAIKSIRKTIDKEIKQRINLLLSEAGNFQKDQFKYSFYENHSMLVPGKPFSLGCPDGALVI